MFTRSDLYNHHVDSGQRWQVLQTLTSNICDFPNFAKTERKHREHIYKQGGRSGEFSDHWPMHLVPDPPSLLMSLPRGPVGLKLTLPPRQNLNATKFAINPCDPYLSLGDRNRSSGCARVDNGCALYSHPSHRAKPARLGTGCDFFASQTPETRTPTFLVCKKSMR